MLGPRTQIIAPNEKTSFICHARGSSVYWHINRESVYQESSFKAKGFHFYYNSLGDEYEHNNTVTVEAHLLNNNTIVSCTALGWNDGLLAYQEGRLIIAGIMNIIIPSINSCMVPRPMLTTLQ